MIGLQQFDTTKCQAMGLDLKQFVEDVDEKFICKLCHKVFLDPLVNGCGHIFCSSCIKKRLKSTTLAHSCTVCSTKLNIESLVQPSTEFRLQLLELAIKCSNKCGRSFPLADLPDHVTDECPNTPMVCPNQEKGCKKKVRRCDLKTHTEECDFRLVECEACGHVIVYFELFTHQSRTRCLEKKLKQQIIRELRNNQHQLKKHWSQLNKMHVRRDIEDRKMILDHTRQMNSGAFAHRSKSCSLESLSKNENSDGIFLTETKAPEAINDLGDSVSCERYPSSKARSQVLCKRCKRRFDPTQNNENACKWHAGTCFACGRVDYQPGCLVSYHQV